MKSNWKSSHVLLEKWFKNKTDTCAAFINLIIQQYSHYNINTALLVTGSNNPNILYSYFVIHYQEALPVSLAIEELQYCV